jgi:transcriptional regulator with XRE-family HTH domain
VAKRLGADKKRIDGTLAEALGAELTDLRKSHRLSQQKLADRLGYDVSYVRQTEMGANPTLELLIAFASVFSLRLSKLIETAEERLRKSTNK